MTRTLGAGAPGHEQQGEEGVDEALHPQEKERGGEALPCSRVCV